MNDMAIYRFRNRMLGYFRHVMPDVKVRKKAIERLNAYLDSIVQLRWQGRVYCWRFTPANPEYRKGREFLFRAYRKIGRKLYPEVYTPEWADREMYYAHKPEAFLEKTRSFVADIVDLLRIDGTGEGKAILLDQPFPVNDPMSVFHFFSSPKAIIVRRDPRDQYLILKHVINRNLFMPVDPVEDYVEYMQIRYRCYDEAQRDPDRILEIQYEDMIFEYDRTTRQIDEFLGIPHEEHSRELFNPQVSCVNTRLYERYPEDAEAIAYIEAHMESYLYPFEKYPKMTSTAEPF